MGQIESMNLYKISPDSIHRYQLKEQFYTLFPFFLVILGISLLLGLIGGMAVLKMALLYAGFFFVLLLYTGIVNFFRSSIAKNTVWSVSSEGIGMQVDRTKLSFLSKLRLRRLERVGKADSYIQWNQVKLVKAKRRGTEIVSKSHNFWDGRGTILIPHELEHYPEVLKSLKQHLPSTAFV